MARRASSSDRLTLYSRYDSDCSTRLRIALNLKGLEYEYVGVTQDMQEQSASASYAKVNYSGCIPTLVVRGAKSSAGTRPEEEEEEEEEDGGKGDTESTHHAGRPVVSAITQSLAALEYLEDAYPASDTRPALLPPSSDPLARATVRSLVDIITTDIHPLTTVRVSRAIGDQFPSPVTEAAVSSGNRDWDAGWMRRGLRLYETMIRETAGRFSVGDMITMADVCLVPQVWTARKTGVVIDDDDDEEFPTVRRVVAACEGEKAFRRAHWACQPDTPQGLRWRMGSGLYGDGGA